MRQFKLIFFLILLLTHIGCKELYHIPVKATAKSLLVVEGTLNSGTGPTTIRLTRTTRIDTIAVVPELSANLYLEGNDNSITTFQESGDGFYFSPQLVISPNVQYRLHIKTADGLEYLSDFINSKNNPPLDSIGWQRNNSGVTIYTSTHDPLNNTKFYRWQYEETWEIHSPHPSTMKYLGNGVIVDVLPPDYTNVCYKYSNSSSILLGSSEKLQSDVIYQQPMLIIPTHDEKLSIRYSILVRQFAMSKEGYLYYQVMKKNTESLGSIFDAQPAEVQGNIHPLANRPESVIGFIDMSPVQEKRIFIDSSSVPEWNFEMNCGVFYVPNVYDSITASMPAVLPFLKIYYGMGVIGYKCSEQQCVDCTFRGGLLTKPTYW